MEFSANHWVIYLGAGIIVLFAIAQSIFFLVRAMKRARAIGIKEETLKKPSQARQYSLLRRL